VTELYAQSERNVVITQLALKRGDLSKNLTPCPAGTDFQIPQDSSPASKGLQHDTLPGRQTDQGDEQDTGHRAPPYRRSGSVI
jgi:hypothetical protein